MLNINDEYFHVNLTMAVNGFVILGLSFDVRKTVFFSVLCDFAVSLAQLFHFLYK